MGLTKLDMDEFLALLQNPEFVMLSHLLISVRGLRPPLNLT
jgi:hypothetical protein